MVKCLSEAQAEAEGQTGVAVTKKAMASWSAYERGLRYGSGKELNRKMTQHLRKQQLIASRESEMHMSLQVTSASSFTSSD